MKRYKDYLGRICFIIITIAFVIVIKMLSPELPIPTEGVPHNYWTPGDTNYMDEDVMWITNNGDTIWE